MTKIEGNNTIGIPENEPAPSDTPPPSNSSVNTGNESTPQPLSLGGPVSMITVTAVIPDASATVEATAPNGDIYTSVSVGPKTVTTMVLTTYHDNNPTPV